MVARLSNAQNIQSFLAQSPPAWNSPSANLVPPHGVSALKPQVGGVQAGSSPYLSTPNRTASPLTLSDRTGLSLSIDEASPGGRSPSSSICILPTSLPEYHRAYMAGGPRATSAVSMASTDNDSPGPGAASPVHGSTSSLPISAVSSPHQGTPSPLGTGISSGATSPVHRRTHSGLRPLATKPQQLASAAGRPEPLTPLSNTQFQQQMMQRQQMMHQETAVKKPKPTRWQFGIRSRNPPLEAVSCIYRALKKLGAEWVAADEDEYSDEYDSDEYSGSDGGSLTGREDTNYGGDEGSPRSTRSRGRSPGGGDDEKDGESSDRRGSRRKAGDGDGDEKEKIKPPEDPWVIHCRWRKNGMVPPKSENAPFGHHPKGHSAASSLASTPKEGGSISTGSSRRASTATGVTEDGTESVYVHMEIQLYKLENSFYLVDFKCGGYERVFEDEDEYSSGSGSGDEYEFDDGIPEEGYVPEDEDEPMTTTPVEEKRVLGVANPDLNEGKTEVGDVGDGQGGSKKKVGFADGDGGGDVTAGGSRRGSDVGGHGHHHHHDQNDHHHHGSDNGIPERGRKPQEDKDVTSPFPFLDMATKLIIQLAEAD